MDAFNGDDIVVVTSGKEKLNFSDSFIGDGVIVSSGIDDSNFSEDYMDEEHAFGVSRLIASPFGEGDIVDESRISTS